MKSIPNLVITGVAIVLLLILISVKPQIDYWKDEAKFWKKSAIRNSHNAEELIQLVHTNRIQLEECEAFNLLLLRQLPVVEGVVVKEFNNERIQ